MTCCHCGYVQSIEATSAIGSGQVIGEYTGNVMLREEYEHNKQFDVYVHCNNNNNKNNNNTWTVFMALSS